MWLSLITRKVMRLCWYLTINRSLICMLQWQRIGMSSLFISNLDGSILILIRRLKCSEFQNKAWCNIIKQLGNPNTIFQTHQTKSTESEKMKSSPSKIILISNLEQKLWTTLIRKLLILISMLLETMILQIAQINLKVKQMITCKKWPMVWEKLIKDL